MAVLHCPNNIKVHYAGAEVQNQYIATEKLGVVYNLYTAYPFVERMVFGKGSAPIMPLDWQKQNPAKLIPKNIIEHSVHTIQDSGLFTLMFGSQSGKKDEALVNKWYDKLVEFSLENANGATCVEVDCQKILNPEKAWEFRYRMKNDLPNNRIINVFHLEDGPKGLDRMIEYSEYIAISVPELRHAGKRFGFIKGHHIRNISTAEIKKKVGNEVWEYIHQYNNETNTNFLCLSIELLKHNYEQAAGKQDYYSL